MIPMNGYGRNDNNLYWKTFTLPAAEDEQQRWYHRVWKYVREHWKYLLIVFIFGVCCGAGTYRLCSKSCGKLPENQEKTSTLANVNKKQNDVGGGAVLNAGFKPFENANKEQEDAKNVQKVGKLMTKDVLNEEVLNNERSQLLEKAFKDLDAMKEGGNFLEQMGQEGEKLDIKKFAKEMESITSQDPKEKNK